MLHILNLIEFRNHLLCQEPQFNMKYQKENVYCSSEKLQLHLNWIYCKNSVVASFSLIESQQGQGGNIWLVSLALFIRPAPNVSHEQFVKARPAVWLPSLLLEDALAELPQTEGAHKVLGVKLAIESGDAAACDGLAAAATQSALPGVEVQWAEGSTVHLHETAVSERLHTVLGGAQEHRWYGKRWRRGGRIQREEGQRWITV